MTSRRGRERPGVAVTRPGASPGRLGELLEASGARVVHWPCIRFEAPADRRPLEAAARLDAAWVALTSPRAARSWLEAVGGHAARCPAAVVGPATAATLEEAGWPVGLVAETPSAGGLLSAFAATGNLAGVRVIFPCSDLAGEELPAGLRRLGAEVVRVTAYRTVASPPDPREILDAARAGRVEVVTFASPSAVEGFLARAGGGDRREITTRLKAAAIGPTTGAALEAVDWPAALAEEPSLEALAAVALQVCGALEPRTS